MTPERINTHSNDDPHSYLGGLRLLLRVILGTSRRNGAKTIRIQYMLPQNIMLWHHDGKVQKDLERMARIPVDQIDTTAPKEDVAQWPDAKVLLGCLMASCRNFKITSGNSVFGGQVQRLNPSAFRSFTAGGRNTPGTTVVLNPRFNLEKMKSAILDELAMLTEGIDIKVILDDKVLESPKSLANGKHRFQPFLNGIYTQYCDDMRVRTATSELFLGGLPIQKQAAKDNNLPSGFIVHLDEDCFFPIHVGAEEMANLSTAMAFIEHDLKGVLKEKLQQARKSMSAEDFAREHSISCVREEVTELLRDCPLHPSLWGYYPQLPHPYLPVVSRSSTDREDYLQKTDFIISQFHWMEGGLLAFGSTYAHAVQWPVLKAPLDPKHWASKAAIDMALIKIAMIPHEIYNTTPLTTARLSGMHLMMCDHYRLEPTDERFPSVNVEQLPTFCSDTNTIVLTPESLDQVAALILQVRNYATLPDSQIDLKALHADTLTILRAARKILADRKNAEHRAYLSSRVKQLGSNLLSGKETGQ